MEANIHRDSNRATVALNGHFDMDSIGKFRDACRGAIADDHVTEVIIDFAETPFIDSIAMGALLMLRDRASETNKSIVLSNCNSRVRRVFDLVDFGRLFAFR